VPPRREQADRAIVDVVVTPATASRALAPRSTSSCVASAVRAVLLAGLHPRTGVTVALQARGSTHNRACACADAPRLRSRCTKTVQRLRRLSMLQSPPPWMHAFRWQVSWVRACGAHARAVGSVLNRAAAHSGCHRRCSAQWRDSYGPNCARGEGTCLACLLSELLVDDRLFGACRRRTG
jgi:hypothetical protein